MTTPSSGTSKRCERSALLLQHRPLVRRIALKVRSRLPAHVDADELMQVGMIGLNDALARFDERRGASFGTYASRRIEGAMLDALRAADTLSRGSRSRLREIRAAVQGLEHRLGRAPRAKEVANELGWTLEDFHRAMVDAGASGCRSTDDVLERLEDEHTGFDAPDPDTTTHAALTGWDDQTDPVRSLQQRQRHRALHTAVDELRDRDRLLMELLYERDLTMHEAAATLGISAARVSQLHEAIVSKLKRRLRDW